jgi:hypothetical protein
MSILALIVIIPIATDNNLRQERGRDSPRSSGHGVDPNRTIFHIRDGLFKCPLMLFALR